MIDRNQLEVVQVQLIRDRMIFREEPIKTSEDVAEIAIEELSHYDREAFCVLNINSKGQIINMNIVSIGSLFSTETHPREVFKSAILSNAGSIIAIHNHPSGDPNPSEADLECTKRLVEAGKILGIPLLDHVIVGCQTNERYSMKARGDI